MPQVFWKVLLAITLVAGAMPMCATEKQWSEGTSRDLREDRHWLEANLRWALSERVEIHDTADSIIVTLPEILFEVDRATLRSDVAITLAKLAGVLQAAPEVFIWIEGHTDSTGPEMHNLELSRRQAGVVESFLAAEGIARYRMGSLGCGERRPVANNETPEGRRRNRRVEIILPWANKAPLLDPPEGTNEDSGDLVTEWTY